jgi:hypothetical protein
MVDGVLVGAKLFVPFNCDSLRQHLSDITEAGSVLDANVHARQRHLEALDLLESAWAIMAYLCRGSLADGWSILCV